jgi:hypothetical protein
MDDAVERTFARIAAVPPETVLAIFRRYGRPLEVTMPAPSADDHRAALPLPDDGTAAVRLLQTLGFGDVIPNDYFVLEQRGEEPLAVPGPLFAGALEALARASGVA